MTHTEVTEVNELTATVVDIDLGLDDIEEAAASADEVKPTATLDDRAADIAQLVERLDAYHLLDTGNWVYLARQTGTRWARDYELRNIPADAMKRVLHRMHVVDAKAKNVPLSRMDSLEPSKHMAVVRELDGGTKIKEQMSLDSLGHVMGRSKDSYGSSPYKLGDDVYNVIREFERHWIKHTQAWANAVPERGALGALIDNAGSGREPEIRHIEHWLWNLAFAPLERRHTLPALCLSGRQAVGKGLIAALCRTILHGQASVAEWTVGTSFEDGLDQLALMYLDEQEAARDNDAWTKQYLGNPRVRVNPKNKPAYHITPSYMVYATTNDMVGALCLSQDFNENRRMSVLIAETQLRHYVMERDGVSEAEAEAWIGGQLMSAIHDDQAVANFLKWVEINNPLIGTPLKAFHGEDYARIMKRQQSSREVDLIDLIKELERAGKSAFKLPDAMTLINKLTQQQGGKMISAEAWPHILETAEKQTGWKLYADRMRWNGDRMTKIVSKYPNDLEAKIATEPELALAMDGLLGQDGQDNGTGQPIPVSSCPTVPAVHPVPTVSTGAEEGDIDHAAMWGVTQ